MAAQATDHLAEYVRILRGFGLSSAEISSHHGVEDGDEAALRAAIRAEVGDDPTHSALYGRAHRLLAHSSRGIDARNRFWNHAPSTQLDDVFGAYGCQFRVLDPETGEPTGCGTHHGPVELVLREPSSGQIRRTRFSFPDTPLDDDNYPALIAAINEELLAETCLRFVLLRNEIDHWRFVLVEEGALRRLRERQGNRIEVFGRPLLRDHQPAAFATDIDALSADGLARLPPELVPEPCDSLSGARSLADRTGASFDAVADDVGGTGAVSYDHGDGGGPSAERLANAAETPVGEAGGDPGVTSSDVLDALEHENAGSDPAVEDGFIWVDPDQLTPTPEAVYEAMLGR